MTKWLEIGPGEGRLPGSWVTVDVAIRPGVVDHLCRWGETPLPFGDETFDLVYASHVLEHIPWYQTVAALYDARRVLRTDGTIEIHVPNFDVLARAVSERRCFDEHAEGGVNAELHWMHWVAERLFHLGCKDQWHRACFNEEHLRWCLQKAGFHDIRRLTDERGRCHGVINLGMSAVR